MAVITCQHCGRLNLDDELRTAGFICERCKQKIPQPGVSSPLQAPESLAPAHLSPDFADGPRVTSNQSGHSGVEHPTIQERTQSLPSNPTHNREDGGSGPSVGDIASQVFGCAMMAIGLLIIPVILIFGRPTGISDKDRIQIEEQRAAEKKEIEQINADYNEIMRRRGLERTTRLGSMTPQKEEELRQLDRQRQERIDRVLGRRK